MNAFPLAALALVLHAGITSANEIESDFAQRGALVRVTDGSGTAEGRLLSQDADSLRIAPGAGAPVRAFDPARLTRYEVRTEEGDRSKLGLQLGFVVGTAIGYAYAADCDCEVETPAWAWAAANGMVGAGLGALVGSFFAHDTWEVVPARMAGLPDGGPLLSLRVRF